MKIITNKEIERDELSQFEDIPGLYFIMLKPTSNTIESFISFMERRHVARNFIASDELNKRDFKISISPLAGDFESKNGEQYFRQYSQIVSEISEPLYIGMTGNLKQRIETHLYQFNKIVSMISSIDQMANLEELNFDEEIESDIQKVNDKANSFAKRLALLLSEYYQEKGVNPSVSSLWFKVKSLTELNSNQISEIESLLIQTIRPMGNIKI